MKFTGNFLGALTAGTFLVMGAANAAEEFDYAKINQSIADSITSVLADDASDNQISFRIDAAGTSLANDEYKIDFSLGMPKAGWTSEPVTGAGSISVEVEAGENGEAPEIDLEKSVTLHTDTLALLKYGVKKKSAKLCPLSDKVTGLNKVVMQEECLFFGKLENAATLEDAFGLMQGHRDAHVRDLEAFIADATADLAALKNQALRQEAERVIARATKMLTALEAATFTQDKDKFLIEASDLDIVAVTMFDGLKDLVTIEGIKVQMTATEITVNAEVELGFGTGIYKHAKPEIARLLKALENGEEYAKEHVKSHTRMILSCLTEKLGGQ